MSAVPQPNELFELAEGVSLRWTLDYAFVDRPEPNPTGRFRQVLFDDRGGSIAEFVPDRIWLRAEATRRSDMPDCMQSSGQWVVSTTLKNLIESFSVLNTEFFPASVVLGAPGSDWEAGTWTPGEEIQGYWLMNCWNRIDAIDAEASDIKWRTSFVGHRPPWVNRWKRLVFKAPILEDLYAFEIMPRHRFVSQRLRDAIKAAELRATLISRPTHVKDR